MVLLRPMGGAGYTTRHRLAGLTNVRGARRLVRTSASRKAKHSSRRGSPRVQPSLLKLDFDVHAGRQVQLHERVHRLVGRVDEVHEAVGGADLKLIPRRFVYL